MSLNHEITTLLNKEGCYIIGFADLRSLSKEVRQNFDYGILIALPYTKDAIQAHKNGLPRRYFTELESINNRLQELAEQTTQLLVAQGYKALAKVRSTLVSDEKWHTILPHKTVATLAGIGWIGKCAMLVTKKFGSALRIIVVLTNAPLDCGTPITKSLCNPNCTICSDICPGQAPQGEAWEIGIDRDTFFDAYACCTAAKAYAKAMLNTDEIVCGLCISHCPFTIAGLGYQ